MIFPSIVQYIDAICGGRDFFRSLPLVDLSIDIHGEPIYCSGNFGVVFCVDIGSERRALKCFTREQKGRKTAWQTIENQMPRSPYIIDYHFLPDELFVSLDQESLDAFSVVDMEWVEGQTLAQAVIQGAESGRRDQLELLSAAFDDMALWLLDSGMAHGDLKPENILVTPRGELRLVDYDGVYLPSMQGQAQREIGSTAYQHPLRCAMDFGPAIDHYSIAMLSFTLRALAGEPKLYSIFGGAGDGLLFLPGQIMSGCCPCYEFLASTALAASPLYSALAGADPTIEGLKEMIARPYEASLDGELIPIKKGDLWGFCDLSDREIAPIYQHVLPFTEGLAAVCLGGKWGYIDLSGSVVVPFRLDDAWSFSQGRALIRYRGKYGFISTQGRRVIAARYDFARSFASSLSAVCYKGRWGYIDLDGRWKIAPEYDYAENFRHGKARVELNDESKILDLETF
ncbi:MAG: WG repeat-containing protein [Mucinivorans sp.]